MTKEFPKLMLLFVQSREKHGYILYGMIGGSKIVPSVWDFYIINTIVIDLDKQYFKCGFLQG